MCVCICVYVYEKGRRGWSSVGRATKVQARGVTANMRVDVFTVSGSGTGDGPGPPPTVASGRCPWAWPAVENGEGFGDNDPCECV